MVKTVSPAILVLSINVRSPKAELIYPSDKDSCIAGYSANIKTFSTNVHVIVTLQYGSLCRVHNIRKLA